MRVDAKQEGPRQSMSWLHTWASLILGWLLYAIFLTGTLSFFQNEITIWMKPELHQSVPSDSQINQTQVALKYLQDNHPNAGSWNIQLPNARQNTTLITVREQGEDPRARRGGTRITLDSSTGQVLESRDTRGGSFLYRFHFDLYGMPRMWARWLVGIATLFMLVAIISGVITHKKIFKDFFTFRPGKGQRSWLDAHNATAVFALPFHIMITFSGLLLLLFTLMPWGIEQIYENRGAFLQEQNRALVQNNPNESQSSNREGRPERNMDANSPTSPEQRGEGRQESAQNSNREGRPERNMDANSPTSREQRGEGRQESAQNSNREGHPERNIDANGPTSREQRGEGRQESAQNSNREGRPERNMNANGPASPEQRGERSGQNENQDKVEIAPAPLTNLTPIIIETQQKWKTNPINSISIINPNTQQAQIELRALDGESVAFRNIYASLQFDGVNGKNTTDENAQLKNPSIPMGIYNVITSLHEARGVQLTLRWLLFLSGVIGTLMVATGLVLWCVKRAPQQQKQGYKSFGFRLVETTNIAAIIGLPIACAGYFYANRIIPANMEARADLEIRAFFIVWLITLIYPIFRTSRQAWLELLAFSAIAYALLPILNFMTGGQAIWNTIAHGQWVIASFDLAMWILAALFAYSFYKVKNHKGLAVKKAKNAMTKQEPDV